MLYTSVLAEVRSGHRIRAAGSASVTALVVLACRLPGDPESGGDLWPSDALIDGMVDERREFRLGFVPHVPGVVDLLKDLGCRQAGDPLCRACGFC